MQPLQAPSLELLLLAPPPPHPNFVVEQPRPLPDRLRRHVVELLWQDILILGVVLDRGQQVGNGRSPPRCFAPARDALRFTNPPQCVECRRKAALWRPWRTLGDQLQCMRRFQGYLNLSRPISRVLAAPLAWNTSFSMSIPAA